MKTYLSRGSQHFVFHKLFLHNFFRSREGATKNWKSTGNLVDGHTPRKGQFKVKQNGGYLRASALLAEVPPPPTSHSPNQISCTSKLTLSIT